MNVSLKFEASSPKNKREDRFLLIFKNSEKIYPKIFSFHSFVLEIFYENYNISKVKKDFLFFKNWIVVYTLSFYIRSNVIFRKKSQTPLCPLFL